MSATSTLPLMRVQYSPTFVEQAVTQCVYGDRKLEARLHRAIDPYYRMPEGREREGRFSSAYWEFFIELGLNARLSALFEERPLLIHEVGRCLVHAAPRAKSEGADLLVKPEAGATVPETRTLTLQLCPETLLDPTRLSAWSRRELLHIQDMVDPAFGYAPWRPEGSPAQQNLVRDRYRVLWDAWVEARLVREGRAGDGETGRLRRMMERAFAGLEPAVIGAGLDRILAAETLTHADLLGWAREPEGLFGARSSAQAADGPDPGDPCPLCKFSTFDWYDFSATGAERAAAAIAGARPGWTPSEGACRQCAEIYTYGSARL